MVRKNNAVSKMNMSGIGIIFSLLLVFVGDVQAAGCDAWTGGDAVNLHAIEHFPTSDTGMAVKIQDNQYKITCTCGIITSWRFYARKSGTVIFYVISGTTVKGSTSINVPALSLDNFFEVPLSSSMWISVKSSDTPYLGFFTSGNPMITWGTGGISSTYATGQSLVAVGSTGTFTGNNIADREYAVGAYVETAHEPMFMNLPYTTTVYSHNTGTILTVAATDLDPDDVSSLVFSTVSGDTSKFSFDTSTKVLSYHTAASPATYNYVVGVSDGCHALVSATVAIIIINEGPKFENLPFSTTVLENTNVAFTYTIQTSDASGDTVTCSLSSVNPTDTTSIFSVTSNEIRQKASPGFSFSTAKYYDLRISCNDGSNTILSNFQFDIDKNEPPAYNAGSGYLPASVAVSSATATNIYTLDATDPEGDSLTYGISCSGSSCPFSLSGSVISTNAVLTEAGYDIQVTLSDGTNTVGPYSLSVLVSVDPRHSSTNDVPLFSNLPTRIRVMENTVANTFLYQLLHTDKNPTNTFTFSNPANSETAVATFFSFDASTQKISTSSSTIDFETIGAGGQLSSASGLWMGLRVHDGTDSLPPLRLRFVIENVNEAPAISIATSSLTIDEGPKDTPFPDPGLADNDPDAGDTHTWSMSCGADSKYFYLNTMDLQVYLAREYDMDSTLSGTGTCVITVTDAGLLASSGTVTLTVININDNTPKFPYNSYSFVLATTATFFMTITNLAATDGDTNSDVPMYAFNTGGASTFFQIDAAGILYVRDVSSFSPGDLYVFQVIATDSGGLIGTCTISIVFSTFSVITTTTTERNFVFEDDPLNPFWLLLVGLVLGSVLVVVGFIVWNDPQFHDWATFKMFRLSEICREKPREPKRSLVHPAKLTVTVNNKTLESDPDNAMPWELLAKDANVPEINEVQEQIQRRKERQDREYLKAGLPVFEKGKGPRPASGGSRPDSESPKYASMDRDGSKAASDQGSHGNNSKEEDDGGEGQWGNLNETRRPRYGSPKVVVPVDVEPPRGSAVGESGEISLPHSSHSIRNEQNSRIRLHSLSGLDDI